METYLIKTNVLLALFYLIYRAVIYQRTDHQFNRLVGIGVLFFTSIFMFIPNIEFNNPNYSHQVVEWAKTTQSIAAPLSMELPKEQFSLFLALYFVGAALLCVRFIISIVGLVRIYRSSVKSKKWGFQLVETLKPISPFSFFHLLFLSRGDHQKPDLTPVVVHEKIHRDQYHSLDVVLLEILSILFWFNPFVWLFRKDIKASHEFIADEAVLRKGFDKVKYKDLLFKARTGISFKAVSYLSNHTSLKQRFNTMDKRKINLTNSYLRAGIVLVAMALTVIISSFSSIGTPLKDGEPDIKVYTASGEVDLEKGISVNTDRIYLRMIPTKGDGLAYRISKAQVTLVSGGVGIGTVQAKEMIELSDILSEVKEKSILVIEVKEYQSKNEKDEIKTIEAQRFLKIPIM